jgi:hypothetical protein
MPTEKLPGPGRLHFRLGSASPPPEVLDANVQKYLADLGVTKNWRVEGIPVKDRTDQICVIDWMSIQCDINAMPYETYLSKQRKRGVTMGEREAELEYTRARGYSVLYVPNRGKAHKWRVINYEAVVRFHHWQADARREAAKHDVGLFPSELLQIAVRTTDRQKRNNQ